jgi:hypothetical protein
VKVRELMVLLMNEDPDSTVLVEVGEATYDVDPECTSSTGMWRFYIATKEEPCAQEDDADG